MEEIQQVHDANCQMCGARKIWRQLNREGVQVSRGRLNRPGWGGARQDSVQQSWSGTASVLLTS
ncbi:IS3 family transposase [Saccharopolyspora sp. ID03-671]